MKLAKRSFGSVLNAAILLLIGFLTVYPFIYILSTSVSSTQALSQQKVILLPRGFSLAAYVQILTYKQLFSSLKNSVVYTIAGTACCVSATMLTAYPLAQKGDFSRYGNFFMKMVIFTMYFSGGMIPTYLLVKSLGMLDTMWSIFVPTLIAPFQLILAKSFVEDIPDSLCEAAKIDGAGEFDIFLRIILPLCLPIIMVLILYNLTGVWNEFRSAMLYINSSDKYPLQIFVRELVIKSQSADRGAFDRTSGFNSETIKAATLVITTLPILIIYPLLQRHLVSGIMVGAVKG